MLTDTTAIVPWSGHRQDIIYMHLYRYLHHNRIKALVLKEKYKQRDMNPSEIRVAQG
jgi:hypothetical protein